MNLTRLSRPELRALSSKLKGWLVAGPELDALNSAEAKIVAALRLDEDEGGSANPDGSGQQKDGDFGQSITGHP